MKQTCEAPFVIDEKKVAELKHIILNLAETDALTFSDKIYEFTQSLEQEFSRNELLKTRLYHLIIGSTPREGQCAVFDLPENRIENFINSLK